MDRVGWAIAGLAIADIGYIHRVLHPASEVGGWTILAGIVLFLCCLID